MHWDGMSDDLWKSTQNAMTAAGGVPSCHVPWDDVERLVEWWMYQPAPQWPWEVDESLAAQGEAIWGAQCASCQQIGHPSAGRIIPIDEIGTDRWRYDLLTPATVEAYNAMAMETYGFGENQTQETEGYLAVLLDAVWLRAPYLHNGSVTHAVGPASASRRSSGDLLPRVRGVRSGAGEVRLRRSGGRRGGFPAMFPGFRRMGIRDICSATISPLSRSGPWSST